MITIQKLDAVECSVSAQDGRILLPCLSYRTAYWVEGPHKKERVEYIKKEFTHTRGGKWRFLTGLLPKICEYLERKGFNYEIVEDSSFKYKTRLPKIDGITLRNDQLKALKAIKENERGTIKAPTGIGKTIIILGTIALYPNNCKTLVLAHNKGIVKQTYDTMMAHNFKSVGRMGDGQNKWNRRWKTVVSTIQTFIKQDPNDYIDFFDIVIVDEGHWVSNTEGNYGKLLLSMLTPIRIAFTATPPTENKQKFALEGLIGPVIYDLTIKEAIDNGIIVTPKIKLIKIPYDHKIRELRKYTDVYSKGIIENTYRNNLILKIAKENTDQNKTVLIMVTRKEHGKILQNTAKKRLNQKIEFIQGSTSSDNREIIKELLIKKKQKCVIANVVWREGINIPTLDVVIRACGGKSEKITLQDIGRGLRKADGKDEVIIYDFFDSSHPHLISHFGERICVYMDNSWI